MPDDNAGTVVTFLYVNHRGEEATRHVIPHGLRFGTSKYYDTPRWLMDAYDLDRDAVRTFDMAKVRDWGPPR